MRKFKSKLLLREFSLYLVESIALFSLCKLHDIVGYGTARKLRELFYWPDGFCLDTVVCAAFFIVAGAICVQGSRIVEIIMDCIGVEE